MEQRTRGLILRTRLLTETSLIVQWLTRDFGRISTVAKGARRAKSLFLGKLDLFYSADLSFHLSRHGDLHTLREVSVREHHQTLRQELDYLRQAAYFVQLLEISTETNTPLPGLYELLESALHAATEGPPDPVVTFAFELKLLEDLGFRPDLAQARLTAGASQLLGQLAGADWSLVRRFKPSAEQLKEIARFLRQFLEEQFGRSPLTRDGSPVDPGRD